MTDRSHEYDELWVFMAKIWLMRIIDKDFQFIYHLIPQ